MHGRNIEGEVCLISVQSTITVVITMHGVYSALLVPSESVANGYFYGMQIFMNG